MVIFDSSILCIFVFGLIAGICPCNNILCLKLIEDLTKKLKNFPKRVRRLFGYLPLPMSMGSHLKKKQQKVPGR